MWRFGFLFLVIGPGAIIAGMYLFLRHWRTTATGKLYKKKGEYVETEKEIISETELQEIEEKLLQLKQKSF